MARRHNHYEAAFEDYLRSRGWPYLPVDEQKKAIFAGARVKSFDFLVYRTGAMGAFDLGVLKMDGEKTTRSLLASVDFSEHNGEVSPNGRWLAYQSNESGEDRIYVKPFPDVDSGRFPISPAGGSEPLWSPDGSELFYRAGDRLMAVPVRTEPAFEAGA